MTTKPNHDAEQAIAQRSVIVDYLAARLGQTVNRRDIQQDTGIDNVQARIHELMQFLDLDGQGVLPKVDGAQLYRLNSLEPVRRKKKEWGVEMKMVNGELTVWPHDKPTVDKARLDAFVAALSTFAAQWWSTDTPIVEDPPQGDFDPFYDPNSNPDEWMDIPE